MAALPIKEEVKPVVQIGKLRKLKDLPSIDMPTEQDTRMNAEDEKIFKALLKHFGNRLNDVYYESLMRFVFGYAHEKERLKVTIEKLTHYLERFEYFNFKTVLDKPMDDEDACLDSWPVFMYGYDKEGHPVMYDEICSSTVEEVKKVFAPTGDTDFDKLRRFRFRFLRRLEHNKFLQSERYGKNITKHIMIMDMKNFSRKHLYQQMRHLVADVIDDESNLFPDTLHRMYIINTPLPFRFAWKIVSNFIHPITVDKIQIVGPDYLKQVTKDIDINQLPPRYKGKGKWKINYGYVADIENDLIDKFQTKQTLKLKFLNENTNSTNNTNNNNNINDDEKDSEELNNSSNNSSSINNNNNSSNSNASFSDARIAESMSNLKVTG